jgi:hypothetical protein
MPCSARSKRKLPHPAANRCEFRRVAEPYARQRTCTTHRSPTRSAAALAVLVIPVRLAEIQSDYRVSQD